MTDPQAWNAQREDLRALPAHPRKVTGSKNVLNSVRLFIDYFITCPERIERATRRLRRYPRPFRRVEIRARDGVRLDAWLGKAADEPRDAILLLPGLWTSKENHRIRERSLRMLRDWGFHVLTLDLRGVGGSQRVPSTPGWKEAEDIVDALAWLRANAPVRRLHLYAESLAASAAIVAAAAEADAGRRLLDGRIIAMSPFGDARETMDLYSHPDPGRTELGKDFVAVQMFFNFLLRLQGFKGGRFDAYIRESARHYGVDHERALRVSSPLHRIQSVNVPLLVLHSEDDGLVPVSQAHALRRAANGNPWADVWVLAWGYHCLYEMAEPDWYWTLLGQVFGSDPGGRSLRPAAATTPTPATV